jgi:hypothetical protein
MPYNEAVYAAGPRYAGLTPPEGYAQGRSNGKINSAHADFYGEWNYTIFTDL